MNLTDSETTTILVALRMFQKQYLDCTASQIAADWPDYFEHVAPPEDDPEACIEPLPLSTEDINALCERMSGEEDDEPDPETEPEAWKEYHRMVAGGSNDAGRIFNDKGLVVEDLNEKERLAVVARRRMFDADKKEPAL